MSSEDFHHEAPQSGHDGVEESALVRHVETKVVKVELDSETDPLQSMVVRERNMQHDMSIQLH